MCIDERRNEKRPFIASGGSDGSNVSSLKRKFSAENASVDDVDNVSAERVHICKSC